MICVLVRCFVIKIRSERTVVARRKGLYFHTLVSSYESSRALHLTVIGRF